MTEVETTSMMEVETTDYYVYFIMKDITWIVT